MTSTVDKLRRKFEPTNRFANFGRLLVLLRIRGIRNHEETEIEFESPVTVITGLNGTGKSTILHVAASLYKHHEKSQQYAVNKFIVTGTLDPNVYSESRIFYGLASVSKTWIGRRLRLSKKGRWEGASKRTSRAVAFFAFKDFLPRIETTDFVVRHARQLHIKSEVDEPILANVASRILGVSYDAVVRQRVVYRTQWRDVLAIVRNGIRYSELQMGYGERRCLYVLDKILRLPDKSTILLEEPEASLHPSAQAEFARFLLELSEQKGHQILLTSHSEHIISALPSESRVYLHRIPGTMQTKVIYGLPARQARALLSDGQQFALQVVVEDKVAEALLKALFRKHDPTLLSTVSVLAASAGAQELKKLSKLFAVIPNTVAVLDGDQVAQPADKVFVLPGGKPPEVFIFESKSFASLLLSRYGIEVSVLRASFGTANHHKWFDLLARKVHQALDVIIAESAEAAASDVPISEVAALITAVKGCIA